MKKAIVTFVAVMAIVGNLHAESFAITEDVCFHPDDKIVTAAVSLPWDYSYVHPVNVGSKPNGEPIFVNCTVTGQKQKFRTFCSACGYIYEEHETTLSENHSISH